jgi:hypothetical protein
MGLKSGSETSLLGYIADLFVGVRVFRIIVTFSPTDRKKVIVYIYNILLYPFVGVRVFLMIVAQTFSMQDFHAYSRYTQYSKGNKHRSNKEYYKLPIA